MPMDKKYVLVTGAANGIGLVTTQYLASKGDFVIATDINEEALNQLKGKENIAPIYMDVTNSGSISNAITEIIKITDGLDVLINNAGLFFGGPLIEVSEKNMSKIIDVNVLGVHRVTRMIFPLLHKTKGRIINIGSEAGRLSWPLNGPYSMTKFALESFSDSLRRELMFLDMKVIHLQIGAVDTDFMDRTISCYAEDIDIEQTLFPKLIGSVIDACEDTKAKSAKPITIAKRIYKIAHKRNPRSRYKIKNDKLRRMAEFLPNSLLDWGIKKLFR
jgi:short-subunit dehydrogenase